MKFFGSALFAVATLASIVSGQQNNVPGTATAPPAASATPTGSAGVSDGLGDNPLSAPTAGDEFKAGKPVTIVWKPTTEGTITLRLRKGDSNNLDTIQDITKDVPNTGTFTWTPSTKLEGDEDYAIEIIPASGEPNYSPKFALDSNGSGLSSSSTATTLSTSTKTSTSAKPTETDDEDDEDKDDDATTTTSKSSTKTTTSDASSKTDDDAPVQEDDDDVPNANSGAGISSSPMALVLCLAAAVAYLN
ncbi:hypothetical protein BJ508DRAFT_418679 [Ascobolus immersus RN42]|uniref:Yeast cell wall synthesis Kre9/Knh1-like N-terminal domain-containing protein n=1 Tax=Ascobolus immersus RN42 TaxID=1160509 RepID=A0A3N4HKE0_ASCIM|nr:hypothetical protein BJ508DRAFT_418679 [Ascobolus immersus RN42]